MEQFLGPAQDLFLLGILQQAKAAAFLDAVGQAQQLFGEGRHVRGHLGAELDVVDLLQEALALDQFLVVGKIVVAGDGRQLVEALDQHPLRIEIAEAVRSGDRFMAQVLCPALDGLEKGGCDLGIVYGVEPAEAQVFRAVFLVGGAVVDGGDAPGRLAILVGQELP